MNKLKVKNRKNKIRFSKIISGLILFLILFLLYSLWIPSSQVFGRTIYRNQNNSVLLTFDDGPGPETETILNILKEENATALFFITCEHINKTEIGLIKRMSEDGNTVGLHGYSHKIFQGYEELNLCKQILEETTGEEINYFRPPYGFKSPNTMLAAKKLNMTIVTWSVFPRDYSAKNREIIIERVEKKLKNNSIICFHDGPGGRENTEEALPEILRTIHEKEYKLTKQIVLK